MITDLRTIARRVLWITLLMATAHGAWDVAGTTVELVRAGASPGLALALFHHLVFSVAVSFLQLAAVNVVGTVLLLPLARLWDPGAAVHAALLVLADFVYMAAAFLGVEYYDGGLAFSAQRVQETVVPYLVGFALATGAVLLLARLLWYRARAAGTVFALAGALGLALPLVHEYRPRPVPGAAPEGRPNVILVVVDALRADHMGLYGYERDTTPFIDSIVEEQGVLFERAYVQYTISTPSHASIYSGCYPHNHGAVTQGTAIPDSTTLLSEVFAEAGYRTAAFHDHRLLGAPQGFARGFQTFVETHEPVMENTNPYVWKRELHALRVWDVLLDRPTVTYTVLDWLEGTREPFYLWLHWSTPHASFKPPQEYIDRFQEGEYDGPMDGSVDYGADYAEILSEEDLAHMVARYDGEIAWMDDHFKALIGLLEERGMAEDTIIAFTSDHGTCFGDHGFYFTHGSVYEESIHVPLFFLWPGHLEAKRVEEVVEVVNVASTLLQLAGLDDDGRFCDGWDLSPAWIEGEAFEAPPAISWKRGRSASADQRFKVVLDRFPNGEVEFYDLEADPEETENLEGRYPEVQKRLLERIDSFCSASKKGLAFCAQQKAIDVEVLDEEMRNQLRSLGYIE